eukprot:Skav202120  [mRNA]  locus=scaffold1980:160103:160603:+ [translate_table: standard]
MVGQFLNNQFIEEFIESMGEGGGHNTDARFKELCDTILEDCIANLSNMEGIVMATQKLLPRVIELVIVRNFGDKSGLVSWKELTKYLNKVTILRMKHAENAEAEARRRESRTGPDTPYEEGGDDADDDEDDDYPPADDDEEMIPEKKKKGKGKGKRKKETASTASK